MNTSTGVELTIFFVVEPPRYQDMGAYLSASIRQHFNEPIKLIGYCPAASIDAMDPKALEAYRRMDVEIRVLETDGVFDPPYPHGNKLLAALDPKDTPYAAFMDSDMLFVEDNTVDQMIRDGHVSVAPATSMYWSGQDIWDTIYDGCGMEKPQERIWLQRQRRRKMMPYFNAGLIVYPEGPQAATGERFPETWMRLAQQIDTLDIVKKRPYLDQMSLPLAIQAAGLKWYLLPEEQHYILGGVLRGQPLPMDKGIKMIHYRNWEILTEIGMNRPAKKMLARTIGVKKLDQIELEHTGNDR